MDSEGSKIFEKSLKVKNNAKRTKNSYSWSKNTEYGFLNREKIEFFFLAQKLEEDLHLLQGPKRRAMPS